MSKFLRLTEVKPALACGVDALRQGRPRGVSCAGQDRPARERLARRGSREVDGGSCRSEPRREVRGASSCNALTSTLHCRSGASSSASSTTPSRPYFVSKKQFSHDDLDGVGELSGLGPAFLLSLPQAEEAAAWNGTRAWTYFIRPESPFIFPSNALPVRLNQADKAHLREALLASAHDSIWVLHDKWSAAVPLTPDIVFRDDMGTIPVFGPRFEPSIQRLNEAVIKVTPAVTYGSSHIKSAAQERKIGRRTK